MLPARASCSYAMAVLGCWLLAWTPSGMAAEEANVTTEALEAQLDEGGKKLAALANAEPPDLVRVKAEAEALLPAARALAAEYRRRCMERNADLAAWLKERDEPLMSAFPSAPLVLFGGATPDDVLAKWKEQLRKTAQAIQDLLTNTKEATGLWLYWQDAEGERREGQPFFRAEQLRDCLRETVKLAGLLTAPRATVRLAKGRILASQDFSGPLNAWQTFGGPELETVAGRLRVKGKGCTLWYAQEFSDAAISFDYEPAAAEGKGAGALFAFPATPRPGQTLEASAGKMENYNRGIETYHVSLYRGGSGMTNVRRTGGGLKMLASVEPDPCAQLKRNYRVVLLKYGPTFQVFVDGKLIHAYVDGGCYGAVPAKGFFGVRHFSATALECFYDNFEVAALEAEAPAGPGRKEQP